MTLGYPEVLGPLSECNRSVRIRGLHDGATVEIFNDNTLVAKDVANSSDQIFNLFPSAILKPGTPVTAVQKKGQESSDLDYPGPIFVQKKPKTLNPLVFSTPVYACANCIGVYGALPGATVTVTANGNYRGEDVAVNGMAFVQLSNPLMSTDQVEAKQSASLPPCGIPSPSPLIKTVPDDTPLIGPNKLPMPIIVEPVKNCAEIVKVGNLVQGAVVSLDGNGFSSSWCSFAGNMPLKVPILNEGDVITAKQEMIPGCELKSDISKAGVIKAGPAKPKIESPICKGARWVTISNLEQEKYVKIFQNDGSEPILVKAKAAVDDFRVPPISGTEIWATQELCGVWSENSDIVPVDPQPTSIPKPVIPGRLFKCATVVRVTNIRPGSHVEIWSEFKKAQINTFDCSNIIYDTWADICVSPLCVSPTGKGDLIKAVVYSCGMPSESDAVEVEDFGDLGSPMVATPIGVCMKSVIVKQVIPGAVVDVYVRRGSSPAKWCGRATAGTDSVEVPIRNCQLQLGDHVSAMQRLCDQKTRRGAESEVTEKPASVVTQHNDNARTGANLKEVVLNVNSVKKDRFRLLFRRFTDGQIYAQPLYVCGVDIPNKGHRNVVYVATMHNTVYAFDADDPAEYAPLWQASLGLSVKLPNSHLGDIPGFQGHILYNDIKIEIGITSTPVIDPVSGTLYVVAFSDDGWQMNPITNQMEYEEGKYNYYLHALDITTGQKRPGSPVGIGGSSPGTEYPTNKSITISFNSIQQLQCSALLLSLGKIYVAFTGFGFNPTIYPYHGWMISFDANTLIRAAAFNTTPTEPFTRTSAYERGGGIWQTGQGPAADPDGDLYFTTGLGHIGYGPGMSSSLLIQNKDLQLYGKFSPYALNSFGGSGGPLLIPGIDEKNKSTTYAFFGGKQGWAYMVDKDKIGITPPVGTGPSGNVQTSDPDAVQSFYIDVGKHIHGGAVYWHGPNGPHVYLWPEGDFLRSYKLDNQGKFMLPISGNPPFAIPESKSLISAPINSMPGGMLSISARGNTPDSGVVWAVVPAQPNSQGISVPGILRAFDASNVSNELWNSEMDPNGHDRLGYMAKTCPPTVANGKVYVATWSGNLAVYGLRPP